jgi:hypothetical protein
VLGLGRLRENKSVKRTAERLVIEIADREFSRPFHGLRRPKIDWPSTEVLGYFHSSASRTELKTVESRNEAVAEGFAYGF